MLTCSPVFSIVFSTFERNSSQPLNSPHPLRDQLAVWFLVVESYKSNYYLVPWICIDLYIFIYFSLTCLYAGHEKTVLLMYQGGNNGLHEAIYHGKPLVILPMVGDQHDIAVRAKDRGVGEWLNIRTLDGDELEAVIRKVVTNER